MPSRFIFSLRFSTKVLVKLMKLSVAMIIFMTLYRLNLFMLAGFAKVEETSLVEVLQAFLVGARFDILVFGFLFIPVIFVLLAQAFSEKWPKWMYLVYKTYFGLVWILISLFTYADFFFYALHGKRMRFAEYSSWNFETLWEQWHTLPVNQTAIYTVITIVLLVLAHMLIRSLDFGNWKDEYSPHPARRGEVALRIILPILIIFLMARGTVEPHHLALEHAQISNNDALNEMGLNAVWCFDK
ncbi:MAG: hypothetical protein ACM3MG_09120 [Bacillota bacterium]